MTRPRKKDRHLPDCVYHRHGAFYYVKGGRWKRIGTTLSEALGEYSRILSAPSGGMARLINQVLDHVEPTLAKSTARQYRVAGRKLAAMMAEFEPDQVRSKHVAEIKVSLRDTPNMANRCLSVLRVVFQHAVEWQLVDSNPCIGIRRHTEAKRGRYLTDDELAAIRGKAGPRLQAIIDLLYLTGQRVSDVLRIRQGDLQPDGIRFQQGKTGAKLTVRWTPDLRAAVERAKALSGPVRALTLFRNARGKTPDYRTVRDQWEAACRLAGVEDAHIHDVRAKSLTDAKRQGKNPTALAGHKSPAMTERYLRGLEEPLVDGPSFGQAKKTELDAGAK